MIDDIHYNKQLNFFNSIIFVFTTNLTNRMYVIVEISNRTFLVVEKVLNSILYRLLTDVRTAYDIIFEYISTFDTRFFTDKRKKKLYRDARTAIQKVRRRKSLRCMESRFVPLFFEIFSTKTPFFRSQLCPWSFYRSGRLESLRNSAFLWTREIVLSLTFTEPSKHMRSVLRHCQKSPKKILKEKKKK